MKVCGNILISVEERHASNILSGVKTVELRRKPVNIESGTQVWVYSKLPKGQVDLVAEAKGVVAGSPDEIWEKFSAECAISKQEFDDYFDGRQAAYAIIFGTVTSLEPILGLREIREKVSSFQPPQFFKRLDTQSPELAFFKTALSIQ